MPNRNSPEVQMNAYELRALRYLWRGLPDLLEEAAKETLLRIGFAKVNAGGTLEITEAGMQRFTVERHRSDLGMAGASPPPVVIAATSQSEGRAG